MNEFKYELHRHTTETSPCAQSPGATVPGDAKEQGFDGVCITDHFWYGYFDKLTGSWPEKIDNFMTGYDRACEAGAKIGVDVIFGAEMQFIDDGSHHIVFGPDRYFLKTAGDLTKISVEAFSIIARSQGFFLYQTHPFRAGSNRSVYHPEDPTVLDGAEVFNARTGEEDNKVTLEWAKKYGLKPVSGSDAHKPGENMPSGMIFPRRIKDGADMARALHGLEWTGFVWNGKTLTYDELMG